MRKIGPIIDAFMIIVTAFIISMMAVDLWKAWSPFDEPAINEYFGEGIVFGIIMFAINWSCDIYNRASND